MSFTQGQSVEIDKSDVTYERANVTRFHGVRGTFERMCASDAHVRIPDVGVRHFPISAVKPVQTVKAGDVVVYKGGTALEAAEPSFVGLIARVIQVGSDASAYFKPLTPRGDLRESSDVYHEFYDRTEGWAHHKYTPVEGDVVEIIHTSVGNEAWKGFKARVALDTQVGGNENLRFWLHPLSERPDGGMSKFRWNADSLRKVTVDEAPKQPLPNTREGVDKAVKDVDASMLRLDEYRRELIAHRATLAVPAPGPYKMIIVPINNEETYRDQLHVFYTDSDGDYFHAEGGDAMRRLFDDYSGESLSWRTHEEMAERFEAIREGRFNVIDKDDLKFHYSW